MEQYVIKRSGPKGPEALVLLPNLIEFATVDSARLGLLPLHQVYEVADGGTYAIVHIVEETDSGFIPGADEFFRPVYNLHASGTRSRVILDQLALMGALAPQTLVA